MTTKKIFEFLNILAPVELAESWDNVGLLVNCDNEIKKVLVCLDITTQTINEAINEQCDLIVSHHPVIFKALKNIKSNDLVFKLIKNNISAICMHTNLDIAKGGVNDILANKLNLTEVIPFDCGGRIGTIKETSVTELAKTCKEIFNSHIRYTDGERLVTKLAVVGGAGAFIDEAYKLGAECLITGDVKHHDGIDAKELGISLIGAGHFATEVPVVNYLAKSLENNFKNLIIYESKINTEPFMVV